MFTRLVRISLPKNWRRLLLLLFVVVADFVGDGDFDWQRVLADDEGAGRAGRIVGQLGYCGQRGLGLSAVLSCDRIV
ncbi:hypothetical protein BpHYR1_050442 [Brachionus plicatilis]|uniref:Uncharacterized protein n=1 Tax=Brachionus plicatilis TaxID=10195 RepID=A0A3M7R8J6_BRAPC|nr:hypothetical protein BpHYR1_050442 [Brachionus plicatilis]